MKKQLILIGLFIGMTNWMNAQTVTNSKTNPVVESAKKDTTKPADNKTAILMTNKKDAKGKTVTVNNNNAATEDKNKAVMDNKKTSVQR